MVVAVEGVVAAVVVVVVVVVVTPEVPALAPPRAGGGSLPWGRACVDAMRALAMAAVPAARMPEVPDLAGPATIEAARSLGPEGVKVVA